MIMEKYILSFKNIDGSIVYGFVNGVLVYYQNEAEMDAEAYAWMFDKLPRDPDTLQNVSQWMNSKGRMNKLDAVPPDTSFDAFWNAYDKKINRKRCEPLWKKMTEPDHVQCIMSIKAYEGFLKRNPARAKMDPENYLRKESYKNNWNAL